MATKGKNMKKTTNYELVLSPYVEKQLIKYAGWHWTIKTVIELTSAGFWS